MLKLHLYKRTFPNLFRKEKRKLQKILGKQVIIEHIGSTAIPETAGKGIIDIMLAFRKQEEIKEAVNILTESGYHLWEDRDRNDRIFMSSTELPESQLGDIHLHLTTADSQSFKNALLFRDYLTRHPNERKQYVDLKYAIAKEVGYNRIKYTQKKHSFINKILELARKES